MDEKIYFYNFVIGLILIDLKQILPMKPSKFETSVSVESYNKKTAKNCRNGYFSEKRMVFKL